MNCYGYKNTVCNNEAITKRKVATGESRGKSGTVKQYDQVPLCGQCNNRYALDKKMAVLLGTVLVVVGLIAFKYWAQ
ncbi:hypothetical protein [Fangia hongkongensis]|uniref:hypothetical protein n=1 Tax=Fangia hongkongensis TaxID=270495 RepID=UPI00036BFC13|nr:hypothetical protein [Fangia hongkongensis]MBK2125290.1 hypothetical protein [Fangia hongkongensis]